MSIGRPQREEAAAETAGTEPALRRAPLGALSCGAALGYFQLRLLETVGAFATFSSAAQ